MSNFSKCKKSLNNIYLIEENVPIKERNRFLLALPYLKIIFLQSRIKLQEVLKCALNCWKLEIIFKWQAKVSNFFRYKYLIPKDFIYGVVDKFQFGIGNESYYGESIRHVNIRLGER